MAQSKTARLLQMRSRVGIRNPGKGAKCIVCRHPESERINCAIWEQAPDAKIAKEFNLSESAIRRHRMNAHVQLKIVHIPQISVFLDPDAPKATQEYVRLVVRVAKDLLDRGAADPKHKIAILSVLERAIRLQAQHAGKATPQPGEDVGADTETSDAVSSFDARLKAAEEKAKREAEMCELSTGKPGRPVLN